MFKLNQLSSHKFNKISTVSSQYIAHFKKLLVSFKIIIIFLSKSCKVKILIRVGFTKVLGTLFEPSWLFVPQFGNHCYIAYPRNIIAKGVMSY